MKPKNKPFHEHDGIHPLEMIDLDVMHCVVDEIYDANGAEVSVDQLFNHGSIGALLNFLVKEKIIHHEESGSHSGTVMVASNVASKHVVLDIVDHWYELQTLKFDHVKVPVANYRDLVNAFDPASFVCGNCRYFKQTPEGTGRCYASPPACKTRDRPVVLADETACRFHKIGGAK